MGIGGAVEVDGVVADVAAVAEVWLGSIHPVLGCEWGEEMT